MAKLVNKPVIVDLIPVRTTSLGSQSVDPDDVLNSPKVQQQLKEIREAREQGKLKIEKPTSSGGAQNDQPHNT